MKNRQLRDLILLALFADIGFVSKRLISPLANILTDLLRIPGGIGTAFSLMFLVIGAYLVRRRYAAAVMGLIQCVLALSLGMTGAMGALSPIGYLIPGIVIDLVFMLCDRLDPDPFITLAAANMAGSAAASITANFIVFRLRGAVLCLYVLTGMICGGVCGMIADILIRRLRPLFRPEGQYRFSDAAQDGESGERV